MQRFRLCGAVVVVSMLAFLVAGSGCSSDKKTDGGSTGGSSGATGSSTKGVKTELASTGWGTLEGVAVFEGTPPTPKDLSDTNPDFKTHADHKFCEEGDTKDPKRWRVNADNKGVQFVVVWVQPPAGKYFKLPPDKTWPDKVLIEQPHCSFEPHVSVAFPGHYDYKTKKPVPSGQKFVVNNTAPMKHNTRLQGSDKNPLQSQTLNSGDTEGHPFKIQADKEPIKLACDIHKWMRGYVWAFDHPYAAVTDKDGKFEIKNVPAGADVDIWYWHESMGDDSQGKKLKTAKLMAGPNKEDITIKEK